MQHDISALKKEKRTKRVTSQLDLPVSEDLSVLASIPRGIVLILARGYNTYLPRQVNTNIPPQERMRAKSSDLVLLVWWQGLCS